MMLATTGRMGGGRGVNEYVSDIRWAAGAYWRCDAGRAVEAKARDIRRHLADAVSQLPAAGRGVVHVGHETPDGEAVEAERFGRIIDTVTAFDAAGKDLRWVYVHLYESYSPPDAEWVLDETVYRFGAACAANPEPLALHYTVLPGEAGSGPGAHWLRAAP